MFTKVCYPAFRSLPEPRERTPCGCTSRLSDVDQPAAKNAPLKDVNQPATKNAPLKSPTIDNPAMALRCRSSRRLVPSTFGKTRRFCGILLYDEITQMVNSKRATYEIREPHMKIGRGICQLGDSVCRPAYDRSLVTMGKIEPYQ